MIDPILGNLSDRTYTPLGSPLAVAFNAAPIPLAFAWILMWSPPAAEAPSFRRARADSHKPCACCFRRARSPRSASCRKSPPIMMNAPPCFGIGRWGGLGSGGLGMNGACLHRVHGRGRKACFSARVIMLSACFGALTDGGFGDRFRRIGQHSPGRPPARIPSLRPSRSRAHSPKSARHFQNAPS